MVALRGLVGLFARERSSCHHRIPAVLRLSVLRPPRGPSTRVRTGWFKTCLSLRAVPLLRVRSLAREPWRTQRPSWSITKTVVGKTRGGERAHTSFVILFPLLRRQESLNQFEAPYVNVKSGRMSTTTFFRGEPVLYHADHKSGRSFFFVYLESLTPSPFPSSGAP